MTERDVTQRPDRLERENRRLKGIGAVVLVGLAAMVLMGQDTPGKVAMVVEAEKFVLVDAEGRTRAILGAYGAGHGLVLYDPNGQVRAILGHAELKAARTGVVEQRPVSSLVLIDKDGKVIWKAP